jgi:DNA-directed RNA polymerase subunit G
MDGINEECEVSSIDRGSLKGNLIIELACGKRKIIFDMIENINTFNKKEKVTMTLSKNRPEFGPNDFCGHGYVVTQKRSENSLTTIISLFGLLVKVNEEPNSNILDDLKMSLMDHVYFCVKKISS